MERVWAFPVLVSLVLAGCAQADATCRPADVETVSWVQPGYAATLWPKLEIPPPGTTGLEHDTGLGPDAYILVWGDRGGPWDVPIDAYPVDEWSYIPNATYHALDGAWDVAFGPMMTNVTIDTDRDPLADGSLMTEMRLMLAALSDANETQKDEAIDEAVRTGRAGKYLLQLPGPPRIGHIWNEEGVVWEMAGRDEYYAHAGAWTFLVNVNGVDVDRAQGPDHHVDLRDRVWADPANLDPDRFPRLTGEPESIAEVVSWYQILGVMNEAEADGVLIAPTEDCVPPPGVGLLP